jgi:hypothetical protein
MQLTTLQSSWKNFTNRIGLKSLDIRSIRSTSSDFKADKSGSTHWVSTATATSAASKTLKREEK